jgi:hypothetical protein
MLTFVDESSEQIPAALVRLERAPAEQYAAVVVDENGGRGRNRVGVGDEPASGALDATLIAFEGAAAARAVLPGVQNSHGPIMPRASATAHELARIELLGSLPGEQLARLAGRMRRETVLAGTTPMVEGEEGDRFYVVLSGMFSVTKSTLGQRAILRPGDYFGEVALAMDIPRTATVRAMTPAVVASCDRATFDEFIRPLFADD